MKLEVCAHTFEWHDGNFIIRHARHPHLEGIVITGGEDPTFLTLHTAIHATAKQYEEEHYYDQDVKTLVLQNLVDTDGEVNPAYQDHQN